LSTSFREQTCHCYDRIISSSRCRLAVYAQYAYRPMHIT